MIVQVAGSLLVLTGFALSQWGLLNPKSITYLVFNLVGSAALAVDAALGAQWGFLLLEGVWAIVSALGLVRSTSSRARDTGSSLDA
jgi:hypothetical protein